MSTGSIFFAVCSIVALVGALATVLARNPIRGAVGLLATILGIAGLFLKLDAQFLAAIQLIVYAGAVVVLFVFVIMLLGPAADAAGPGKSALSRYFGGGLLAFLAGAIVMLVGRTAGTPTPFQPARIEHGTVEAVGGMLFTKGLVPFDLATALLVVAVVGAMAVARGRHVPKVNKDDGDNPTRRMFQGPVHPRDTGHPIAKEESR